MRKVRAMIYAAETKITVGNTEVWILANGIAFERIYRTNVCRKKLFVLPVMMMDFEDFPRQTPPLSLSSENNNNNKQMLSLNCSNKIFAMPATFGRVALRLKICDGISNESVKGFMICRMLPCCSSPQTRAWVWGMGDDFAYLIEMGEDCWRWLVLCVRKLQKQAE